MFVFARAATYAALFIGLLLVFLPGRILSSTGVVQPPAIGVGNSPGCLWEPPVPHSRSHVSSHSFSSAGAPPHRSIRLVNW